MTFGRPTMITKSKNVPVPLLIDDEYLSAEDDGIQPPQIPSRMGLFVSTCSLFEILDDILCSFYVKDTGFASPRHNETTTRISEMIAEALQFNRRLDTFIAGIPKYLQMKDNSRTTVSDRNTCVNLQQQILHCR